MTDPKALREKLDAMVKMLFPYFDEVSSDSRKLRMMDKVAIDLLEENQTLLREKEERHTPCVWTLDGVGEGWYLGCDPREWQQSKGNFCSGCGHPVQVKQPQDAVTEEEE